MLLQNAQIDTIYGEYNLHKNNIFRVYVPLSGDTGLSNFDFVQIIQIYRGF